MLRGLLADFKDYPATLILGLLWVVVFVVMVANQLWTGPVPTFHQFTIGTIGSAHRYGDLTVSELLRGEVWRCVTCTFVHYNILHISTNLMGLYLFGCLVEMWYGRWQFVALYVVIGGGGNLVSALARQAIGTNPLVHSGGGSTLVIGLVALCAVVGWRSKSRIGDHLRRDAVGILLFTAFLGQMTAVVDNWGHAGGALMGALMGFAHRALVRSAARPAARWAGIAAAVIIAASGVAQVRENRVEDDQRRVVDAWRRTQEARQLEHALVQTGVFYRQAVVRSGFEHTRLIPASFLRRRSVPGPVKAAAVPSVFEMPDAAFRNVQQQYLAMLEHARGTLRNGPDAEAFDCVSQRLLRVLDQPPSAAAVRSFQTRLSVLIARAQTIRRDAQARYERLAGGREGVSVNRPARSPGAGSVAGPHAPRP